MNPHRPHVCTFHFLFFFLTFNFLGLWLERHWETRRHDTVKEIDTEAFINATRTQKNVKLSLSMTGVRTHFIGLMIDPK